MGSRTEILRRIRSGRLEDTPYPDYRVTSSFESSWAQFGESLKKVSGSLHCVPDLSALEAKVKSLQVFMQAGQVYCDVPGLKLGDRTMQSETPHELEDLDLAITVGELAVVENAAIWVGPRVMKHRATLFLTQHLMLVVEARQLVKDLHEAYARIDCSNLNFGCWISGPSKTADVEQSLVIGAHGPRSLSVFAVGA